MKERLSKIYFDDQPVRLMGDEARPPLSRIVRAGGKRPDRIDVVVLKSHADMVGQPIGQEEIIDRTVEPTKPIYLRSVPKTAPAAAAAPLPNVGRVVAQPGSETPQEPATARRGQGFKGTAFQAPSSAPPPPLASEPAPEVVPVVLRKPKPSLTTAEAEAEERQEEERDQQNALQDEQEELEAADEDARQD